ncbi:hypothetical protein [Nocardia puris]|uniref:Uncharacterized protein n=1 Tax=Nocardia puris TaxID=208602 RepID=A0A366DEW0_9NOCA|nr:hypothetical protein [Nocardia puris]RBO87954.1 hypothetical protein DFR74_110210 [Nocardia puris]
MNFTATVRDRVYAVAVAVAGLLVVLNVLPTGSETLVADIASGVGAAFVASAALLAKLNVHTPPPER